VVVDATAVDATSVSVDLVEANVSRKKNPNSRWNKGNERYPKDLLNLILKHYHEQHGWHKGARVVRGR
jgi:hypothetical protein